MKKALVFLLLFVSCHFGFSQEAFNYTEELNRSAHIPNTPEAEAFKQYGSVPINLYEGKSNVSVPLYTYSGREMNLPISLTYDMDARKVEDIASSVGMGWNLNLGGRVSRITKGLPDLYKTLSGDQYPSLFDSTLLGNYLSLKDKFFNHYTQTPPHNPNIEFANQAEAELYFKTLNDVQVGKADIHLDHYSVNAGSLSDIIILKDSTGLEPMTVQNTRTDVTYAIAQNGNDPDYITQWIITDDNGVKYTFAVVEETNSKNYDDITDPTTSTTKAYDVVFNTSWLLTEMLSANKKDKYTFEYINDSFWAQEAQTNSIHAANYSLDGLTSESTPSTSYFHKQKFLKRVLHNDNEIVNITYKNRDDHDLPNSAIASIKVKSPFDGAIIKYFELNHSYFGSTDPSATLFEKRLKLDSIKIAGRGYNGSHSYNFKSKYAFDYESPEYMPSRKTFARDIFGFYNAELFNDDPNGTPPNPVLYPKKTYDIGNTQVTLQGANRDFDFASAKIGILNRITYPTGGFSEFEYEQHKETIYEDNVTSTVTIDVYADESGLFDATQCGTCCSGGQTNADAPIVSESSFTLTSNQHNLFDFNYEVTDGDNNSDYRAYVVGPLSNPSNTYTYEDICNGNVVPFRIFNGQNMILLNDIALDIGFYQVFVFNPDRPDVPCTTPGVNCSRVRLKIRNPTVTSQTPIDVFYDGLRVKSVTNYTDENQPATKTIYEYYELDENYQPILDYQTTEDYFGPGGNVQTQTVYHRLGKPILGDGPYISYGRVIEKQVSPTTGNGSIGYIEHEFYNSGYMGYVPSEAPPFETEYYTNIRKGQMKQNTSYDSNDNKKTQSNNSYMHEIGTWHSEVALGDIPENSVKFIQLYYEGTNVKARYLNGQQGPMGISPPSECNTTGIKCLVGNANSRNRPLFVYTRQEHLKRSTNKSKEFFYNINGVDVSSISTTDFDRNRGYLPRKTSVLTSDDNKEIITEYTYPEDVPTEPKMGDLITANRIAQPVEVQTFQKEGIAQTQELMQSQKTVFGTFNSLILPELVQTAKGTNVLEDRISYKYDNYGNPKEISRPGSPPTSIIWGYDHEVPVAKIENAAYSTIPSAIITDIQDASARLTGNVQDLLDALDDLRTAAALSNAMITTYTYEPMIGLSTVTDSKGYTMSYLYNDENQLEFVKDQDGNVLSKQEYNLKNQ